QLGREQLRLRDRPDVAVWGVDLAVLCSKEGRERTAVIRRRQHVARAADDSARDAQVVEALELRGEVERVDGPGQPERAHGGGHGPADDPTEMAHRVAAAHDLPYEGDHARPHRLRQWQP